MFQVAIVDDQKEAIVMNRIVKTGRLLLFQVAMNI